MENWSGLCDICGECDTCSRPGIWQGAESCLPRLRCIPTKLLSILPSFLAWLTVPHKLTFPESLPIPSKLHSCLRTYAQLKMSDVCCVTVLLPSRSCPCRGFAPLGSLILCCLSSFFVTWFRRPWCSGYPVWMISQSTHHPAGCAPSPTSVHSWLIAHWCVSS